MQPWNRSLVSVIGHPEAVGQFAIISLTEHDDNGDHLYWSNDEGWTQIDRCDLWSHDDLMRFRLPQDGAWVTMDWEPTQGIEGTV